MTPVPTGQISEHGFAIKDEFANMYLIKDSLGYIAIDAGKDIKVIISEMHKLNINPDEVIAVFDTFRHGPRCWYSFIQKCQIVYGKK
ncbi:MAG: hypothetical protein IPQ10_00080 [Saprospiraceae bacterium]|nr:hypothetical protein [Saprospiraceae bacterium]